MEVERAVKNKAETTATVPMSVLINIEIGVDSLSTPFTCWIRYTEKKA